MWWRIAAGCTDKTFADRTFANAEARFGHAMISVGRSEIAAEKFGIVLNLSGEKEESIIQ